MEVDDVMEDVDVEVTEEATENASIIVKLQSWGSIEFITQGPWAVVTLFCTVATKGLKAINSADPYI